MRPGDGVGGARTRDGSALVPPRVVAGRTAALSDFLAELEIEFAREVSEDVFNLVEAEGRLELRPPGEARRSGIHAVFPPDAGRANRSRGPLHRAFGKRIVEIIDLTAGLGGDAYRLAEAGYRVRGVERHPVVYALLATGWARDLDLGHVPRDVAERLAFSHADGRDVVAGLDSPDVGVYLDPMYPQPRRSRALPKRELQVLRQLLGEEEDAAALVDVALPRAARVVVKRPHRAPPLRPGVSFELSSKLVRFDVYVNPLKMGEVLS